MRLWNRPRLTDRPDHVSRSAPLVRKIWHALIKVYIINFARHHSRCNTRRSRWNASRCITLLVVWRTGRKTVLLHSLDPLRMQLKGRLNIITDVWMMIVFSRHIYIYTRAGPNCFYLSAVSWKSLPCRSYPQVLWLSTPLQHFLSTVPFNLLFGVYRHYIVGSPFNIMSMMTSKLTNCGAV